MARHVELHGFAERVERMCDFFLDQVPRDGSADIQVIQKIKEDARDIQAMRPYAGLDDYMRGHPGSPKEL